MPYRCRICEARRGEPKGATRIWRTGQSRNNDLMKEHFCSCCHVFSLRQIRDWFENAVDHGLQLSFQRLRWQEEAVGKNQGCWLFQVPFKQSHPVIFSDLFRKRHVGIDNLFHVRGRLSLKNRLQVTIASLIAYMSPTCTGRLHGS